MTIIIGCPCSITWRMTKNSAILLRRFIIWWIILSFYFASCELLTNLKNDEKCWTTFCATNTFSKFLPLAHPAIFYSTFFVIEERGEKDHPVCCWCAKNIFYRNNTFPPLFPSAPLVPISLFFTPLFARPRRALAAFMIYIKLLLDQKLNCSLLIKNYCCLIR